MAKKIQDIFKKKEPLNQEIPAPEIKSAETPVDFEVAPKLEMPGPVETISPTAAPTMPEIAPAPVEVAAPTVTPVAKNPTIEKIEDVLEEDLEEVYFKMPPEKQAEFSKQGEVTATEIAGLLQQTKLKIKKILELIRNWLKIIPGINKFFLEQEVKIKTDKILDIKEEAANSTDQNQNKI